MTEGTDETLSVVVERKLPYPPEKIWRALTQPHLLEEWLMKTDFKPALGHRFKFSAEWGAVDCEILKIEPNRMLSYTWGDTRLKTVVTWTLTPAGKGTNLRMEQHGFREDQPRYYQGATAGWPNFFANLEQLLARID